MPLVDPVTMSAPAPSATKKSLPIDLLPTDLSRTLAHAHPVLLLAAYYLRFPALVTDPIHTLQHSLLPLAIIQITYVFCCLPHAGSHAKPAKALKWKKRVHETATASKVYTIIFALILSLLSTPLLATTQILFGAPFTTHMPHTLLSSAHIALLAIFPLFYVHGIASPMWREIASLYCPLDEVFGAAVGAFVGAWLGAVPIPLDWDREWQKWPVTVCTGAYGGYVAGKLVCGTLLRGKRISFE